MNDVGRDAASQPAGAAEVRSVFDILTPPFSIDQLLATPLWAGSHCQTAKRLGAGAERWKRGRGVGSWGMEEGRWKMGEGRGVLGEGVFVSVLVVDISAFRFFLSEKHIRRNNVFATVTSRTCQGQLVPTES